MLRYCAFLLALMIFSAGSGRVSAENRVALVVGNANYAHTTPLANPRNDARDMTAALKSIGFDVVEAIDADKSKLGKKNAENQPTRHAVSSTKKQLSFARTNLARNTVSVCTRTSCRRIDQQETALLDKA